MIGLKNIESVIGFIILVLVYLFSVTVAGCFRAWVAKKMGDDTAEEFGFLTLNPLNHVDLFGFSVLILFCDVSRTIFPGFLAGRSVPIYTGFGWGKQVPVDVSHIHGRYRWLNVACVLFSDSLMHFIMPVIALFGLKILMLGWNPAMALSPSILLGIQLYRAFVYLNVWLFVFEFIVNGVILGLSYYGQTGSLFDMYQLSYVSLLVTIVMMFLLGSFISELVVGAITVVGNWIL